MSEIFIDAERDERGIEQVFIEAVVAQRFNRIDQVIDLAGVDDTEAVDIPTYGSMTSVTHQL